MRENRSYGSVRGALGDRRPYRDPGKWGAWRATAGPTRRHPRIAERVMVAILYDCAVFYNRQSADGNRFALHRSSQTSRNSRESGCNQFKFQI